MTPLRWPATDPVAGRVRLRAFRDTDLPMVLDLATDPYVPRISTLPADADEAAALAYIGRQHGRLAEGRGFSFCVALTDDSAAVGTAGLWVDDLGHGRFRGGYTIAPGRRGHGLAGDALRALTAFAWTLEVAHRVELYVEPWNVASLRTAERAGYVCEGLLRDHHRIGGAWCDMVLLAALRPVSGG
ncbi:GNAT family N-acetyltransferase [Phycicoccus sonneratiae]|uniref:GNAT family N-acetyltransferase n=1 Tax=Phycicoccus sonneratiae TaxID=2807628 RepID=A0ABS2CGP3_9MICO|nr:GNAT family protein [Phycicoccus sonneraticus]MBM6399036.1 GNAT family N-acetyltransferase [Phycicoccus sonneraticus]